MLLRLVALIFPFVFVAYTAPALPGPALADAPAFSLSGKDLLSEANAAAGSVASPAVVLLDDEHWTIQDANHIEHRRHYIVKVLDSSAIQLFSGVQERWESWHEQRPTVRARVVTGDGTVHELDPKSLVDAPAGTNLPQAYSDVRVIQGPLPAVEVGSVVEVETTQTSQPALGSLVFRGYAAGAVPVRLSRLVLDYPESIPLRYRTDLCPDAKESKTTENGRVHLSLTLGSFESVAQIDELLPFDAPRVPSVTFSTGTSWNELARTYNDVVDKQIAGAPVTGLVSGAIGKETDRRTIIDKLMHALHNEVRYTGVEFGDAAVVPAKPADTLSRKYGDCKDKASLLVAMLRQAGIPAYVAILNAGLDQDVSPDYPGMGMFNHAIVYVPGSPALWIDATAAHTALGTLPPADEGRLALIIRNDTTALTKIPESRSSANVSNTLRSFELPDFGPAHVSQTVSGTGIYDSTFREFFAAEENDEFRKNLQQQTQAEWETKSPVEITHPPVDDFTKPFALNVDIRDAKSVTISETGGSIPFQPGSVLSGLPRYFFTPEDKNDQSKKVRTAGFVLPAAFIEKATYRVQLPAGFVVRQMPQNQTVPLGPGNYSARYELNGQVLTAELSFDSGKRTYSLEEGNQLRKAVLEFMKQPPPVLAVEPKGQALLDDGKLRGGLDAFRELASHHPNQAEADAINHVRLARAYLSVGCGQQAREEAQLAAKTAPALAVTWRAVAFVHEHDLIGRKFKPGWDPAIAESALRKAISLDKDDAAIQAELAETFEYTAAGVRYGSMARVRQAADLFEAMGDDKLEQQGRSGSSPLGSGLSG